MQTPWIQRPSCKSHLYVNINTYIEFYRRHPTEPETGRQNSRKREPKPICLKDLSLLSLPFAMGSNSTKQCESGEKQGESSTKKFKLASQQSTRDFFSPLSLHLSDLGEAPPYKMTSPWASGQRWTSPQVGQILFPQNHIQSILSLVDT